MVKIILVSTREKIFDSFITGLQSDEDVDVEFCNKAQCAIDMTRRHYPQLVVIDYHLEDMTHVRLADTLRKLDADIPLYMVTTMDEKYFRQATADISQVYRLPSPPFAGDAHGVIQQLHETAC